MARKKTKKKSSVQLGRWKQSQRKRGRFIRRALSWTEAPYVNISRRIDPSVRHNISAINKREKIRPPELVKAITGKALSKALSSRKLGWRKDTREKKNDFTEEKRKRIVSENMGIINSIANQWWRSKLVKQAFGGRRDNFLRETELFVLEGLSYFDPKREDKKGELIKISKWIKGSAKLFCRRKYYEEKRRLEKEGKHALERAKGTDLPIVGRSWIPWAARGFLRKLGLDPEKVADLGFDDVRKQILEIVKAKETGLTPKEQKVVMLRLEGKTLIEIAERLELRAKSGIHGSEGIAAKKIRGRLKKL